MRSTITKGIEQVDADEWAVVSKGHPYASREWCLYGEQVISAPGYYVIVYDDNDVAIGGASYYVLYDDGLPIKNVLLHRAVKWYLRHFPMVVARTAYGTNYKGIFLPDEPSHQEAALNLILDAGKQITRENRGSFLICDYLQEEEMTNQWQDFVKLHDFLDVGTLLEAADFDTFEDYMQDLRQKKGKRPPKDIRRHSRKAVEQGIQVRFQKEMPNIDTAVELIESIDNKYDGVLFRPYTREMIESSMQLPAENAFWMVACVKDELISCELMLFDTETGVCTPSLFGREQTVEYSYFYTFYEVIRHSIESLSATKIIGNSGKEHFKLRMGFEPDCRNYFAVYMPSMLSRAIASILLSILQRQETDATAGPSAEDEFEYAEN